MPSVEYRVVRFIEATTQVATSGDAVSNKKYCSDLILTVGVTFV